MFRFARRGGDGMSRKNMAAIRRSEKRTVGKATGSPETSRNTNEKEKPFLRDKGEKLYTAKGEWDNDWQPSMSSVVKLLLSLRISSALWGIISDCDEVYNYWEPLHLFLYGRGFQTWEYSPIYAVRSYFYVYLHYIPASLMSTLMQGSKIVVFVCMRCLLGGFCLFGEYLLYAAICKKINIAAGRNFVIFTLFSSGMFLSSTAFLPSSFAMTINFYLLTAYLNEQWWLAIGCTAVSALVGWPFAAVLGLPIVIDMLLVRNLRLLFFQWAAIFGVGVTGIMYLCDSHYFGKSVIAPLNIVLYNVLGGPGPELYGVEPVSYYIKNLILNWNVAFPLAVISLPLSAYCYRKHHRPAEVHSIKFGIPRSLHYWRRFIPVFLIGFSAATWCAIFFTQPHKEERFMFPIYPHIAFLAAVAFEAVTRLVGRYSDSAANGVWTTILVFMLLSMSRSFSIHRSYGAHIEIYKALNEHLTIEGFNHSKMNEPIRVCVGKEWYRFPSSFFLPDAVGSATEWKPVELSFIESEFRGILPKPFLDSTNNVVEITRHIPTEMNDQNKEERGRYVALETCDFVIDVDMPATEREPDFRTMTDKFETVTQIPFIVAHESHNLFRAFYIPYFSNKYTVWTNYSLYRRK